MPPTTTILNRPLSISGYWFRGRPFGDVLHLLADELGIHSVGLWPHLIEGLTPTQIRDELARTGTAAYCLNVPGDHRLNSGQASEPAQRALLDAIVLASRLDIRLVQVYAGTDTRRDAEDNVRSYARALRPFVDEAAGHGITLAVENNLDQRREDALGVNPSRRPERLRMLAELIDSDKFGLVYDPCNYFTVGVEPFPGPYSQLKPWIVSVEFKDVVPYDATAHPDAADLHLLSDSNTGSYVPVAVGNGRVDPLPILRQLDKDQYSGVVALDPFATGDTLLNHCRDSVAFLQRSGLVDAATVS